MKQIIIFGILAISSFAVAKENFSIETRDPKMFELSIKKTFEEWGAVPYCSSNATVEQKKYFASMEILQVARQACDSRKAELLRLTHFEGTCDSGASGFGGKRRPPSYKMEISAVFRCI